MPLWWLVGAVSWALAQDANAASAPRPAKLGLCVACHGQDGMAVTADAPHLAGQRERYLASALAAYRAGTRRHAAMQAVAGTLSQRDVAAFARWYSSQPAAPRGREDKSGDRAP